MYLKSIEVHGFKSFANKIKFQFHNGITCIVGPNGSGKSNVADAVRWVLGEQRIKQLRGASMQDVIFSGTESRKPLGYAYVAITLDNADHQLAIEYDEVTIARRIYRSGESEYLLNGTPCRLKDVNELFYDTGIGKEGYSIIGQGQIDKILSGKPEERRELFDEAAGIVKFKKRKLTAQKKLEDEKQNLIRVSDILSELEKQISPLEKQSETARIYLKKKEDLKTLDVNVFLLENNRLREQKTTVEQKLSIADGDLSDTTAKYEGIKEEYERVQAEVERLDGEIEEARNMLTDSSVMRGKLEGQINVMKEQINSARGNEGHLQSRSRTLQSEIESKNLEREKILGDKTEIDEQLAQLERAGAESKALLSEIQGRLEALNLKTEQGKNGIINTLNDRATIKSKMGRYDTMLEQIEQRRAELNARFLRAKSDESQQEGIIIKLKEEFEAVSQVIGGLHKKQQGMEERLAQIHDVLTEKDGLYRDEQVSYHQDKSKLDSITNMTERYEGYGGSIRRVMEQKERTKGIIGVVADIIKVESAYETAIETALGGSIQNIVTEDEETAKRMISFLKQNKYGRATFLPLTSISRTQDFRMTEVLKEKGAIGLADTLVSLEDRFKNVAKSLLGRILVVDNVDNAMAIAKKYNHSIRMVTLEGEQLIPGGAISGGAFKNSSNLLGRRRELEALEKKVKEHLLRIDGLLETIEGTKQERNQLRLDVLEVKNSLQEQFIIQNTARMNVIKAEERKHAAVQGFDTLKREELEIAEQIRDISANKEGILRELKESEERECTLEEGIKANQAELDQWKQKESEQNGRVSQAEVSVEKIRQQHLFCSQNLERIHGDILRFTKELDEIKEALETNRGEIAGKEASIRELEQTIAASGTILGESEEKLKRDVARKEELSVKQKNFFAGREEMSQRMSSLDKEVFRLHTQMEKLEESIENQINYMWDEYQITLSDAVSKRNETMTELLTMKKEIADLKEQIRKLGDVNVNAIEDYKNLCERYLFLKTQHDDLVQAEQTLQGIIEELDASMRKQFREKFGEIYREFDSVFKELFGGGKGTLELMEDEDILEAGIRIIAQPPGKKLQNMMQLSGGEKALTAIALLFAIQNLKPSPFCLLDEIEAALDDSNVGRFAKYLHKLTRHTQFIVITHRRGTMEAADRLYGITMQEKGVSALVSVNLIEKDLEE